MNYYLQSRCKDFSTLIRDLPNRKLVKELGDLCTIYSLMREDIDYYQKRIHSLERDYI